MLWAILELKATIADSGGLVELRLDGASVLTFTGDTRNAGTAEIAMIRFSNHHISSGNRHTLRLDDVYFCDTSGGRNDNFLGDVRVVTLRPNADTARRISRRRRAASHTAWSPRRRTTMATRPTSRAARSATRTSTATRT